jgi:hypothetical protein
MQLSGTTISEFKKFVITENLSLVAKRPFSFSKMLANQKVLVSG